MDPQCILGRPYLASLDHPSIGMPALGLKHVIIFVGCLCANFVRFTTSIPFLESLQSISVISSYILTSYFGGQSVTHKKILTLIVSQVLSLQRSQVSHFAHKVASVACCSQVSQVSKKACFHDAYVVPIMT
jgi:hypothetical protein